MSPDNPTSIPVKQVVKNDDGDTILFYFAADLNYSYSIHIFDGTVVVNIVDDDPNHVLS